MPENIWITLLGSLLTILTGVTLMAWRQVNTLRNNDMHELRERLVRIETKMDLHLQWHLAEKDKQ